MLVIACMKVFYFMRHVGEKLIERVPQLAFLGIRSDAQTLGQTLQICRLFHYCHFENLLRKNTGKDR